MNPFPGYQPGHISGQVMGPFLYQILSIHCVVTQLVEVTLITLEDRVSVCTGATTAWFTFRTRSDSKLSSAAPIA
jgi:hypothetical protein